MKAIKTIIVLFFSFAASLGLYGCGDADVPGMEALQQAAAEGLSLPALTAVVKDVRSGQELERKLNQEGGVNNLDLNGDRKVDYIFVSEFGEPTRKIGYSLTTKPAKGEVQEIAEVTVEKNGENAEIQVTGNEQIYGDGAIYNDFIPNKRKVSQASASTGGSVFPFLTGYFIGRTLWSSPWGFGHYPPMYMSFPDVDGGKYFSRNKRKYKLSKIRSGKSPYKKYSKVRIQNPNKGKYAGKGIVRSLKKPTATQKQFRTTRAKSLKSGGFGRSGSKKVSSVARSGSGKRLFSSGKNSPARKGFGSGKSGAVSSGKKSFFGRSFRSSSFSSRSFGRGK